MKVVDMHCDTIGEIFKNKELREKKDIFTNNDMHIDLTKLKKGEYLLQNFAMFVNLRKTEDAYEYCKEMIGYYKYLMEKYKGEITAVDSYKNISDGSKLYGMLTVEEGDCTKGEPEKLYELYGMGVRMMTLTWNYENSIGFPATPRDIVTGKKLEPDFERGLTDKGRIIVEEMMRLGVIVDVSHLSDGGFYDVLAISRMMKVPFVASHSNARSVAGSLRNLTDDMIKGIGECGGVIGLNFYPPFLADKNIDNISVQFEHIIKHIRHIINVGGLKCIGLGSDFDGIDGVLAISDASCMQKLYDYLKKNGFSEIEVEHIFYRNVLNVYKEVL